MKKIENEGKGLKEKKRKEWKQRKSKTNEKKK